MKRIYLALTIAIGLLTTKALTAQNEFITVWAPSSGEIVIPTNGLFTYDYNLTWSILGSQTPLGSGNNRTGQTTIIGVGTDTIEVKITGTFPVFFMNNGGGGTNPDELIDVKQWGDNQWQSFDGSFYGCNNLTISATDKPELSQVINMAHMFKGASKFNTDIGDWDVNSVKNMEEMFEDATAFNQDIGDWDVSQVVNMNNMFLNASSFNQNIGSWSIDMVTDMNGIFTNATSFNQSLEDWEISLISSISLSNCGMDCYNYSRTLHGWAINPNVATGVTLDATGMENSADQIILNDISHLTYSGALNWTINGSPTQGSCTGTVTIPFIAIWNTVGGDSNDDQIYVPASLGNFNYSYTEVDANYDVIGQTQYGNNYGGDTLTFITPGLYRIEITPDPYYGNPFNRINFNNGYDKEKILLIEQWGNFIEWSSFENAFYGCTNLDVTATDIPKLTNVTNTSYAFAETGLTTLPNFNNWDLSNVTNMSYMFKGVSGYMPVMENWDVSNVTDMSGMFAGATEFNQDISGWDVSNVTNMSNMFNGATNFDQDLSGWDVSNVTDMSFMFSGASGLTNLGLEEGEYHSKANGVDDWDVGQVTNMEGMFANAIQFNGDIGNWDVGQVTSMTDMFSGAISFNGDLGNWDVGQLTANGIGTSNDISFANSGMSCGNYSLTLQGWTNQSNTPLNIVVDATGMEYSPDITANRTALINDYSWTFKGDGEGNCFLSLEEFQASSFTIYPNPTQTQFTITGLSGNETIQLVDMTGRVLQTEKTQNNSSESINVNHLANGVYNLIISTENGQSVTQKLIKQ